MCRSKKNWGIFQINIVDYERSMTWSSTEGKLRRKMEEFLGKERFSDLGWFIVVELRKMKLKLEVSESVGLGFSKGNLWKKRKRKKRIDEEGNRSKRKSQRLGRI